MARKRRKRQHGVHNAVANAAAAPPEPAFPSEPASVEIDGSVHEGGGQMVRAALGLGAALGRSVVVTRVRAGRWTPGLRQQHVAGAVLCGSVAGGRVYGAQVGSLAVRYDPPPPPPAGPAASPPPPPSPPRPAHPPDPAAEARGPLRAPLGSAGSAALVLQAALPALVARAPAGAVALEGGTHVPAAPTAEYVRCVFVPAASRFGVHVTYDVQRRGFFPRGRGAVAAGAAAAPDGVAPWRQTRRADVVRVRGWVVPAAPALAACGAAARMRAGARRVLRGAFGAGFEACADEPLDVEVVPVDGAAAPGTSLSVTLVAETADGGALGASLTLDPRAAREFVPPGTRPADAFADAAEDVGARVAQELVEDVQSGACVDRHMADQVPLLMALASGESEVTAPAITQHMRSVKEVLDRFGIGLTFEEAQGASEDVPIVKIVCAGQAGVP